MSKPPLLSHRPDSGRPTSPWRRARVLARIRRGTSRGIRSGRRSFRLVVAAALAFAAVLPTVAPASDAESSPEGWTVLLSPELGVSDLSELQERMRAPIALPHDGELRLRQTWKDDGRGIAHCAGYYEARAAGLAAYGALDEGLEQLVRATCQPLRALASARTSARSYVRELDLGSAELRMPLEIAPVLHQPEREMAEMLYGRGRSWKAIFRQATFRTEGTSTLVIDNGGIEVTFSALAWADFDGDATEDVLLSVRTAATNGSRRPIRHVILTRKSAGGDLAWVRELD